MNQQSTLPPFSLFQISPGSPKYCYESQSMTVFLQLTGPYFDRNNVTNDPSFNCSLNGSNLQTEQVSSLMLKIKEIIRLNIVKQKYSRFNFDVLFNIVEQRDNNQDIMPAIVNLLSFGFVTSGIEIKSLFASSALWLDENDKILWRAPQKQKQEPKYMCIVMESSQKQLTYSKFKGQFAFVHYQRMCNILMDACEQIHTYIIKQVSSANDQYQN